MSIDLLPIAYAKTSDELGDALEDVIDNAHQQGLVVYSTWILPTGQRFIVQHMSLDEEHHVDALPDATKIVDFVETGLVHTPLAIAEDVYIAKLSLA